MKINLEILDASYIFANEAVSDLNTKKLVPKMVLRRRLTRASKLVIELMENIDAKDKRIVFGTSFGELLATSKILNAILEEDILSPTDFQNSVYNTAVSYASILFGNPNEILTISSGDETSLKVLKAGAIKALDEDELLLVVCETINIDKLEEVNDCIDFLESAVALKVKASSKETTINYNDFEEKGFPKSVEHMLNIAKKFDKNSENVIEVEL